VLILGSSLLTVMYVRNLSHGQVPSSCIYAIIQGSCLKHVCKESFKQSDTLNFHIRAHNGECPFMCAVCEKSFKEPDALKMHLHTHTGG
jgi:uncharacterized Zn-finger protein